MNNKPVVVIPNLNGGQELLAAIRSLQEQSLKPRIIVVDNDSTDGSAQSAQDKFPDIEIIWHSKNMGYAGGVNAGIRKAMQDNAQWVAVFNDDAIADGDYLKLLVEFLESNPKYGAVSPKVLKGDSGELDSTGDYVTSWGLPYPRGRGEKDTGQYDDSLNIFAASGAASLFSTKALEEVGLFDEDFFAYYEDVDLGFRLQLAGWKIGFVPNSHVYHAIGMTSGRMKGFTTYQTLKNQPLVVWKNIPTRYLWTVGWRFTLAYLLFFGRAISRGHIISAFKGVFMAIVLTIKKVPARQKIQSTKKVSDDYIWYIITHDLPPNAKALRNFRNAWWKISKR